ncbi:MAG: TIGR03619 family F420-dependent LLM class oxidoreductase [Pseudomonadota bacterium]
MNLADASFGVCILPTDLTLPPTDLACEVESRGFDMLFFPENSHVPIERSKKAYHHPELVEPLARMHDSITALAGCAAVTERLLLGTGVCLLTERDPIVTAKSIASLDRVSQGRIIFGVAGGWIREAMENHGTPFKKRWQVVKERTLAMQTLWREEEAEFQSEFVNFGPTWCYPKPLTPGGPPIYIGSNHKNVADRVADYADGWIPLHGRYDGDPIDDLRVACEKAERDHSEVDMVLFDVPKDIDVIEDHLNRGCTKFAFLVEPTNGEATLKALDEINDFLDLLS